MNKLIFFILIFNAAVFSQNFTASVSKNPVVQGENFRVVFSLNAQGTEFEAPSFSGFTVVGGPSQSTSTSIINGKMSMKQSWTYVLRASNRGEFFIGPATVKSDGKTVKSNRIKVKVSEPSQAEKQRRKAEAQKEKQLQDQAEKVISDNLYMKIKISKSKAAIGEQILATYELYANEDLNIVQLDLNDLPNFNGFWTQEFDQEPRWERTIENGVRFKKAVIKQVLLYPQQSGKLTLDPMTWDAVVRLRTQGGRRRRRSIFDDFFDRGSYRDFNYTVSSGSRSIEITDLPEPKPLTFFGAVGQYEMETWLDKTKVKAGETITLKVKLSGSGNMKLLLPPELDLPPGFELFEPKMTDNARSTTAGTSGNIIFEYLMIPRNEGEFKIPAFEYSYYDPAANKYKTLSSDEYKVQVEKGDGTQDQTVITGVNKENIQYLGKDIRFIKAKSDFTKGNFVFLTSIWYWFIILLGFLILILLILYKRKTDDEKVNQVRLKTRKAKKIARKRLANAKQYLDNNDNDKFFEEMVKALWGYISDKLSIPASELSKESVSEKLENKGVNLKTSSEILELIETCEFARYAPSSSENQPGNIFTRSGELITNIEEELR